MVRTRLARWMAATTFALFFAGLGATAMAVSQPHMYNARGYLRSALSELQTAEADKGGHRNNAINLVKQALGEVNAGIAYANSQ
jgi:hypothetical protein